MLAWQARSVQRDVLVLPEAAGARTGVVGTGPSRRVLVVGESTAAGVGVDDQRDALAHQLARVLPGTIDWQVVARTGLTARAAAAALLPDVTGPLDLVVVVLGVNDSLRLRPRRIWRRDVELVLAGLRARVGADVDVVLCGVPDLGAIPLFPRPLRTVLGARSRLLDAELADLATGDPHLTHVATPTPTPEHLSRDRIHPGASGYAEWAAHLAASVRGRWPAP